MTSIDTNVANYSLAELLTIVGVDSLDSDTILEKTNYYVQKYRDKNPELSVFFQEIQSQLLQYADGDDEDDDESDNDNDDVRENSTSNPEQIHVTVEGFSTMGNEAIYPAGNKQVSNWYENQYLTQSDEVQASKITDRTQKIQVFGNDHVPMNREQIATTDTFALPVKQDSLNPNLKNSISRFINLDSQFRQYTSGADAQATNYTCDLSDTIKNALKLSLYSYQIPFSWYVIDHAYGNTCFWINNPATGNLVTLSLPPGNYTPTAFVTQLNAAFLVKGFTFPARTSPVALAVNTPVVYNASNGLLSLYLDGGAFVNPDNATDAFYLTSETQVIFYDFSSKLLCESNNCYAKSNHYFNSTLGWNMGFRVPYVAVDPSGNTGTAVLDLNGTKYLILVIDDFNQNHVNNSLVSISQVSSNLKVPSYYTNDHPYTCIPAGQRGNNLSELMADLTPTTQNGLLIAGKYQQEYTPTQVVLPSAPRTLTNSQLYTINAINANNNNLTNYLAKAPTSSDILAIIPVKTSVGVPTGSLLVEFSGSLQDSERTYFGPVDIERLAVKLLDDKGNVLNLNGNDWCVSLIAECLYQY